MRFLSLLSLILIVGCTHHTATQCVKGSLLQYPNLTVPDYTKAESVAVVLQALNKVYSLSGRPQTIKEVKRFDKEFEPFLRAIKNPDDLALLAVVCSNLVYYGNAGDDYIDAYFERCFSWSLARLGELKGNSAREALKSIKYKMQLDGAASFDYKAALEHQNKINSMSP
jgi:hypothetical protein